MFVCESNLMTVYERLKMTSLMLKASQVPSNDNNRNRCAFTRCCLPLLWHMHMKLFYSQETGLEDARMRQSQRSWRSEVLRE